MSFIDDLFGKGSSVPQPVADKLIAAGDDLESMTSVVLDALADNKSKKDRVRTRLQEAGEEYIAKRDAFRRRKDQGVVTEIEEAGTLDELDEALQHQEQEAELMNIFRANERGCRDFLHGIERIRAQGAHRMSAEALDMLRERVAQMNEEHRIKDLAGREFHSVNEDIRKQAERRRAESVDERRARHLSAPKQKDSVARAHHELE